MLEIDLWWLDWHPQFWSRTRRMDLLVLNVHSCGLAEDHRGKGDPPTENGLRANLKQQWLPVFFWLAESPCSHATCNCHTQFHRAFGMTPGCPKSSFGRLRNGYSERFRTQGADMLTLLDMGMLAIVFWFLHKNEQRVEFWLDIFA